MAKSFIHPFCLVQKAIIGFFTIVREQLFKLF